MLENYLKIAARSLLKYKAYSLINVLAGDAKTALTAPNTLVINQSTAKKYFGHSNPVGQSLIFDNTDTYKVTGVIADMPDNSHFHFDFIAALVTSEESRNDQWVSNNFNIYLLLREGADPRSLEAKFPAMIEKYIGPAVQQFIGVSLEEFYKSGNKLRYYLQPLRDIHLHSELTAEFEANGNIKYVYIFSAIAFFILLIACINFMNLSTARSANRAKEVGVRKVVGSGREQLIRQFLAESIFLSLIALLLALVFAELALPQFNRLAEKQLHSFYLSNWPLLASIVAITLLVGIMAGSYPAFVLSAFKPVSVLHGKLS